jgi:hypothetical protein
MQAHEVLRQAADVIRAGWAAGGTHAEDAAGKPVPLHGPSTQGTARVGINPRAVRFSAYGSVVKVLAGREANSVAPQPIWIKLHELAKAKSPARPGGNNHLHPLIQFNADPERTAEDVVALLLEAADALDPAKLALEAGRAT